MNAAKKARNCMCSRQSSHSSTVEHRPRALLTFPVVHSGKNPGSHSLARVVARCWALSFTGGTQPNHVHTKPFVHPSSHARMLSTTAWRGRVEKDLAELRASPVAGMGLEAPAVRARARPPAPVSHRSRLTPGCSQDFCTAVMRVTAVAKCTHARQHHALACIACARAAGSLSLTPTPPPPSRCRAQPDAHHPAHVPVRRA